MSFSVDSSGIAAMIERIQTVIDFMPTFAEEAVQSIADYTVLMLHDECPYDGELNNGIIPGETGHLRDSFGSRMVGAGMQAEAEITTTSPIKLGYVTGGYDDYILPTLKKALWWPALSHPVAWVTGQQPNDFVTPAHDEIDTMVPDILQPILDEIKTALEE